jgi:hypothetical protein
MVKVFDGINRAGGGPSPDFDACSAKEVSEIARVFYCLGKYFG